MLSVNVRFRTQQRKMAEVCILTFLVQVRDINVIQMLLCHECVNLMRQHGLQAQEIPMDVSAGCRSGLHSSA
uniref:Uncharacterized protein n=1 Tax=Aegilops tauschii subsp. strangulata TaxID=200361 RepID=A0A453IUN1_AEGTS